MEPSLKIETVNVSDRNKGGWFDKKYNYMSWALSSLEFKEYYDKVELMTDALVYDLLLNKLELPYTKVDISPDLLNDDHPDLWASGRIYTYSVQDESFMDTDVDVFIYQKFEESFEKSALISQNIEKGFDYSDLVLTAIKQNYDYLPDYQHESQSKNNQILAGNAGLLAGSSSDFMKEYTAETFRFVWSQNSDSGDVHDLIGRLDFLVLHNVKQLLYQDVLEIV